MYTLSSFFILLLFYIQAGQQPDFPEDLFTVKEKKKIENNLDDLEERIEVYKDASDRIYRNFCDDIESDNYVSATSRLETWSLLLSESLKDIEASVTSKDKKMKDLTQYEIQIRKAIKDLNDYRLQAPFEHQETFEQCIERAENVRIKIVDIVFK